MSPPRATATAADVSLRDLGPAEVRPSRLRVASVPAGHPYVVHLGLSAAGIEVLADPRPPGAPAGRWWPPVMLDAGWISAHAGSFDLLHIHFGAESLSIAALSSALDALARAGRPLVYTVHDLTNPQLADQSHHREQLDVLIPRAAELITLTAGAAAEIARRWDRSATVIPHPRLLDPGLTVPMGTVAGAPITPTYEVGVHLRDLRPSIDGPGVARGLAGATSRLSADGVDVRGRIAMFTQVRDASAADAVRAVVASTPQVSVVSQPRASEAALVEDLSRLDVSVLPYRYGTHSGWAELCWDLALPLAGAAVGYIEEQHAEPGWFSVCDPTDPGSLAAALRGALRDGPPAGHLRPGPGRAGVIAARRAQRDHCQPQLAESHRTVYLRALAH